MKVKIIPLSGFDWTALLSTFCEIYLKLTQYPVFFFGGEFWLSSDSNFHGYKFNVAFLKIQDLAWNCHTSKV